MAIQDSIQQARQRGASTDQILEEISRQNPRVQTNITTARGRGASSDNILNEILSQNPIRKPGLFSKIGGFIARGGLIKKPSELLFGTTGKTVGTLLGAGAESVKELVTGKPAGRTFRDQPITPFDIAFTALELLPGGGALTKLVRKLPGANLVATKIDDAIKLLSGKQKEKAVKLFTEGLAPTTKKTKREAARIVPELIERGEAGTLKGLKETAIEGTIKSGEQIDELLKGIGKNKVETKPILEGINKFKERFIIDGKVVEPLAIKTADDIERVVLSLGKEVDVDSLVKLRRIWDKQIAKKGAGFGLDDLTTFSNDIKKEATASIRSVLAKESPELDLLNKEFSFWRGVDDVVGATLERTAGQSGKLRSRIGQGFGSVAGGVTGGVPGVFIGAEVGKRLTQAFNSAAWKTKSAIWRNRFADRLIEGNFEGLAIMLKELGIVVKNVADLVSE